MYQDIQKKVREIFIIRGVIHNDSQWISFLLFFALDNRHNMVCLFSAPILGFPKHFCATSKIFSLKALAILDRI